MPRRKKSDGDGTPAPPPGHNDDLTRYVDRVENLVTEQRELAAQLKDVLQEAEDHGLHKKALRAIVKRRLETADEQAGREAFETTFEDMLARLGMLKDTPLGQAAAEDASSRRPLN